MKLIRARSILFCGVALSCCLTSVQAVAEEAAPTATAPEGATRLDEIMVTATRRVDTVSRVPLSVTAMTQSTLDRQGIRRVDELVRMVPSVQLRKTGQEGNSAVYIRGIASELGAPTTGVYLDDVALSKRNISEVNNGNGTAFPPIFDLDRVEVLRGPQGTLFGSGSEGGTIRFITPSPSLTRRSLYVRSSTSITEGGGISYETGAGVGGPIIQDKLGFRLSIFGSHTGGYVDHVSIYDGHTGLTPLK